MTAQPFIHPAYCRREDARQPLRWVRSRDLKAMADYIRTLLAARRLGTRA